MILTLFLEKNRIKTSTKTYPSSKNPETYTKIIAEYPRSDSKGYRGKKSIKVFHNF